MPELALTPWIPAHPGETPVVPGRIGLCWAGSRGHQNDHQRSTTLAAMQPIVDFATAQRLEIQSLQFGVDVPAPLLPCPGGDFYDTACAVASCELIVTVDTSIAHLAGTLGRPTWLLVPFAGEWRWLEDRSDSPWYPTMTVLRQTRPGDWAGVVARVVDSLSQGLE